MGDESAVKEPVSTDVVMSESELAEFKLEEAPDPDQPADDAKPDDGKEAPKEDPKPEDDKDSKDPDKKKDEGETDPDAKDKDPDPDPEEEDDGDPVLVEYAGQKYTQSDFDRLIKGSMLDADYTQKAQKLGEQRSSIEPLIQLIGKLKDEDSKEIVKAIREAIVEEKGEEAGKLFDQTLDFKADEYEHPDTVKAKDLQEKLSTHEAKEAFTDAKKTFITDMKTKGIKVSSKEADEVGQFTMDYFVKNQSAIPLKDAYKLMKADGWRTQAADVTKAAKEAEKKAKDKAAHDAIPSKEKGASDFSSKKGTPKDMEDITMKDVEELGVSLFDE